MAAAFRRTDPVAEGKEASNAAATPPSTSKLPRAEHDTEEWQAPMQALLLVAENAAREQRTKTAEGALRKITGCQRPLFPP
jgi:hypothetical protein